MADIGSVLNGRYEVLGEIGCGGLATVYMAVDRNSNMTWAVKEIPTASVGAGEGQKAAALMESMLMAKLSHASIPRVEEVFEADDAIYIVMEYLPGRTLENTVREFGPMAPMAAIQVGIRLCEVLDYLHSMPAPIIFCDLKPSNVILTDRETPAVKLFDFGAACVYEEGRDAGTEWFGTKNFTAPEMVSGGWQLDTRADIFSLGATLCFLLTGRGPDEKGYGADLGGEETCGLEAILRQCLQAEPEERYATCAEVRSDLEKCLADEVLPGTMKMGTREMEGIPEMAVGRTVKLGATAPLGEGRTGQEQPGGYAERKIGFRPELDILVCGADDWL